MCVSEEVKGQRRYAGKWDFKVTEQNQLLNIVDCVSFSPNTQEPYNMAMLVFVPPLFLLDGMYSEM